MFSFRVYKTRYLFDDANTQVFGNEMENGLNQERGVKDVQLRR